MVLEIAETPEDGALRTMLVNYACHPVTLAESSVVFSRDFPYFTEKHLREALGPGLDLAFAQGCCGDLDPLRRGGLAEAEWTGKLLAESILGSRAQTRPSPQGEPAALSLRTIHVRIPLERAYSHDQLERLAEESQASLDLPLTQPPGAERDLWRKIYEARLRYSRRMLAASGSGTLPDAIEAEIAVIRIGALVLVTLPFESFNEIGARIKAHFGSGNTMVICYANGDFGYFPSERLYDRAAYEVKEAFLYYGWPGPIARNATETLLGAILT
jgi:hypothetical protein